MIESLDGGAVTFGDNAGVGKVISKLVGIFQFVEVVTSLSVFAFGGLACLPLNITGPLLSGHPAGRRVSTAGASSKRDFGGLGGTTKFVFGTRAKGSLV